MNPMNPNGAFIRTQVGCVQLGGSSHRDVTLMVGRWGRLDIWGHWAVGWDTGVMKSLSHSGLASVGIIGHGSHPVRGGFQGPVWL